MAGSLTMSTGLEESQTTQVEVRIALCTCYPEKPGTTQSVAIKRISFAKNKTEHAGIDKEVCYSICTECSSNK